MADRSLDPLDYLEVRIKEARHIERADDAEVDLELCVKERLAAKEDKVKEAWDYVACWSNEVVGLNLDEYKRRCGISELLYTPEQLKIDEAKEEERERRKKDEDDRRIALLVKEMEDAGSFTEWKDKGIEEERRAARQAIRNVDKWIVKLTDKEQQVVRDAIKEYKTKWGETTPTKQKVIPFPIADEDAGIVLGYYDKASSGGRLGFQRLYHQLNPNPTSTIRLGDISPPLHPIYSGIYAGEFYCDYIEVVNGKARKAWDMFLDVDGLEFPNGELIPDEDKKDELVRKAGEKIYTMGKWMSKEAYDSIAKERNDPALRWGIPRRGYINK